MADEQCTGGDRAGGPEMERPLPGGFVNPVVRVGATVRRRQPARAGFVRDLLEHLHRCGFSGAPHYLGMDAAGRQVLSFVDGYAAWRPADQAWVRSPDSLAAVAVLVRQFHDLTAGTSLAGDAEVVCHNDLSPKNTIYRDTGAGPRPVALIDWDIAAPGARVHDVAHVCWQYVGLGPAVTDPGHAADLVRLVADAYGLADRSRLVEAILWWQDRCWRGIQSGAEAGDPAMVRLRDLGAVAGVRAAHRWTIRHRHILARALG